MNEILKNNQIKPSFSKTDSVSYYIFFINKNKDSQLKTTFYKDYQPHTNQNSELKKEHNSGKDVVSYYIYNLKKPKFYTEKVFVNKKENTFSEVKEENTKPEEFCTPYSSEWFLIFTLIGLISLAFLRNKFKKKIESIFSSVINYRIALQNFRESISNPEKSNFLLKFLFYVNFAAFLFQSVCYYFPSQLTINPLLLYIYLFFSVSSLIFIHKTSNLILGYIFKTVNIAKEYNFNIDNFNYSFGLILIFIIPLVSFTQESLNYIFIYTGLAALVLLYLLRVYRLVVLNLKNSINLFHIFLYICTFEIMPVFALQKSSYLLINKFL